MAEDRRLQIDGRKVAAKPWRLPWWGSLCIVFASFLLALLFGRFGKASLARPSLYSAALVIVAVAMRWQMKRYVWFWITVIIIAILHVLLVVLVPWTTAWVPAFVIIPIGIADLYGMLAIFSEVRKFIERLETSKKW